MLQTKQIQLRPGLVQPQDSIEESQRKHYQFSRKTHMKKLSSWQAHKLSYDSPQRKTSQRYNLSTLKQKTDTCISEREEKLQTDGSQIDHFSKIQTGTAQNKPRKNRITLPDVFQPKNLMNNRNSSTKRSLSTKPFHQNANEENRNGENVNSPSQNFRRRSISQVSSKSKNSIKMSTLIGDEQRASQLPLLRDNHDKLKDTFPEDLNQNNVTFGYKKLKISSSIQPLVEKNAQKDITFATLQQIPHEHYITFGSNWKQKATAMQKYRSLQETPKHRQEITCEKMLQMQRKLYKKVTYQVGMTALDAKIVEGIKSMKRIYS